ncbi:MFS transporter [Schleiferilactobacillus harbinensis]|uniref:MFS transporter n=1 Tax=Schleiferilactobacillus harbinensis TaxID=304207 RepID=A0A510TTP7_9LACO|nr:MFS transporter [Schleiferilactobacillus harbinensis]HAY52910.1 MFS transporter [Lactobacillus sp.]MBO3092946.1 MFS transporter [Schleiferilactobacillus harbinensis]MCI1686820.1 MFS transporter [Schleiferilactobacillus harbinensis]MCI1782695.1 MFS transporter [Schleiferilactobacillus harbinensis]MCI1849639.1 MFS transporter [Schleiferilactobacillus harbinensis]
MKRLRGLRDLQGWQRNLAVLWLGTFIAGMGFSEISPFLSLYVSEMGDFTKSELSMYSGVTFAATFLVVALVSPLWGRLADRRGRKLMLLRSSLGMAFIIGATGFVHNIWALIGLRALQGLVSGYIPNASALIATETPKEHSGAAIGILTTGMVSGNLIGPVLGGFLAQVFSIRLTFVITGFLLLIVFFLSLTLVHEHYQPSPALLNKQKRPSLLSQVKNPKAIMTLLISTMIIQVGNMSVYPIISLYVKELMHNVGPIALVAGLIAALPGISNLIAAPRLGRLGDRYGSGKILIFGYIFAVLMYIPQGIVGSVWALAFFRLMIGVSDGALFPTVQTLLSKGTPQDYTGTVFSWNQSFQALGSVIGSLMGGFVTSLFDYNGCFLFTAGCLALNFILVILFIPELRLKNLRRAQ